MPRIINEDLDLQNAYRVIDALDGVNPQDYVTLAQISAEIAANAVASLSGGGGTPMVGDVALVSGANVTLTEDSGAKTITIASSGSGGGSQPGNSELVYRYTVSGSDKASIDTGVDTPDAGSNDWTNGDLLELWLIARTDDVGATSAISLTLNNDSGSNYDQQNLIGSGTTASASSVLAAASQSIICHGSGGTASYPAVNQLSLPGFAGTAFFKVGSLLSSRNDGTTANNRVVYSAVGYRSTSAITRLAVAAAAGQKLKVGTQLLIYKRLAS